ncbi:MAG TPA: group 1 truncated hemoglobin [Kofleriaceae bacterium]|nr:group 1 truncated hemoglobin [Kofleriaceae bacterium]
MRTLLLSIVIVASSFTLAAAQKGSGAPATKSLFDRLGGKSAIQAVVHQFVTNVAADKVISKRFAKTNTKKLEATLVDQVCAATGGPCKYAGKTMADAHKGMKITEDEWKATVADLKSALDKFKVKDAEQNDLLGALAGMHDDIVGK